ncbi:MAG: hypothetical protein ACPGYT_05015 [Nitrospirales bacterium]
MALQLSPLVGSLAVSDRMGDEYPEFLATGRIVQGHSVSGVLSADIVTLVNQDLNDSCWRTSFHNALKDNHQFQRGLVTFAQDNHGRSTRPVDPNALLMLQQPEWELANFNVSMIKNLSEKRLSWEDNHRYEYGFALIKTSASLLYTIQLCHQMNLVAVTDSASHHQLLERTCCRDNKVIKNICIERQGY